MREVERAAPDDLWQRVSECLDHIAIRVQDIGLRIEQHHAARNVLDDNLEALLCDTHLLFKVDDTLATCADLGLWIVH